MYRRLSSLFMPLTLLGLAIFLATVIEGMPGSQLALLKLLPPAIAAISLSLCLRFNRSLVFFTTLALFLAYAMMQWYLPQRGWVEAKIIWLALALLLPFNILVISLLRERGIFTWWGGTRFALLLLPVLLVLAAVSYFPEALLQLFRWRFVELGLLQQLSFSQPALAVMVVALLVLNGRWFAHMSAQNSALMVALICALAMLYFRQADAVSAVFASAALLILVIAVVQESWSMAYIDQLTGLPGRRALEEELLKLGSNYTIAMLDIDHFKKFNDTYGHDAGDQVLQMVAARIRQSVTGGKAFRYGGEEFTIVYPGRKVKEALEPLNQVRQCVGDSIFQLRAIDRCSGKNKKQGGKKVQVTISIGVADRTERMTTPHAVIKGADTALYRAKKQGRNRVCK